MRADGTVASSDVDSGHPPMIEMTQLSGDFRRRDRSARLLSSADALRPTRGVFTENASAPCTAGEKDENGRVTTVRPSRRGHGPGQLTAIDRPRRSPTPCRLHEVDGRTPRHAVHRMPGPRPRPRRRATLHVGEREALPSSLPGMSERVLTSAADWRFVRRHPRPQSPGVCAQRCSSTLQDLDLAREQCTTPRIDRLAHHSS